MIDSSHILILSKLYGEAHKVPLTTVSSRVFNDGKKIAMIEAGGDLTVGRFNDALRWFDENWPVELEWPKSVMRPVKDAAE